MIYRDVWDVVPGLHCNVGPHHIGTFKVQIFSIRTNYVLYDAAV